MRVIHHTGFTVATLERALPFWRDALGMEVVVDQEMKGGYLGEIVGFPDAHAHIVHLRFPDGEERVELFEYLSPPGVSSRLRAIDVGFAHIAVSCDELDDVLARLIAAGGEPVSAPVYIDRGVNTGGRAVYVRDPDGHVVELFEPVTVRQ